MREIPLTRGKYAIVDDGDFEYLSRWKWCFSHGYAKRDVGRTHIYMHREVNKTPDGLLTDHINMNGLDNRRANLRTGDKKLNSINRGLQSNNTSGYRGVGWDSRNKKWHVKIKVDQKTMHFGSYPDKQDAIKVREDIERMYFTCIK